MSTTARHQIWIVLAAVVVFFTQLGAPRLWDEDETIYAEVAREMHERGDWVVPMFNGDLSLDKPALVYWLMMSAYELFGMSEFAARFWSPILSIGTVLLTYHIGRRLYNSNVGFWSALVLATNVIYDVSARAATPDSSLVFLTTLATYLFIRSGGVAGTGPSWLGYVGVYAAMGVATLAKGPVGIVLPTAVLGLYLMMLRQSPGKAIKDETIWSVAARLPWAWTQRFFRALWALRPFTAIAVIALVALPWYIWVGMRTDGKWLEGFFGFHNYHRFTQAIQGHEGPIYYYLATIAVGFFPWCVFLLPSLFYLGRRIRQQQTSQQADVFVAGWAAVYVVFFSLANTKLPNYVLPAYPAIALLIGAFLDQWLSQPVAVPRAWHRAAFATTTLVGLAALVVLPIAARQYFPSDAWLAVLGVAPLVGGVAALVLCEKQRLRPALVTYATMLVVFCTGLLGFGATSMSKYHTSPLLVIQAKNSGATAGEIATFNHFDFNLVYYAGQLVREYTSADDVKRFFQQSPTTFLVTRVDQLPQLDGALPADVTVLARYPWFLRHGEIVLLGRAGTAQRASTAPNAAR